MNDNRYKYVLCLGSYLNKQGGEYFDTDRMIIGLKDEEESIIYPHPITSYLDIKYHRKSGSINTERTAGIQVVQYLNFILDNVQNHNSNFKEVRGLEDLELKHADLYLEYCVEEKGNSNETLNAKENYITSFYDFLWKQKILKEKPNFITTEYYYENSVKTKLTLDFNYKRTNDIYKRKIIKRKDVVPRSHETNENRKIIRLNYMRELLLIASEIVPDIAFGIALQFYAGLRAGEVLNLIISALKPQNGCKYGERGLVIEIKDRQDELFIGKKSKAGEQVKRERDQSALIDPILSYLYEKHVSKVLKSNKKRKNRNALFCDTEGNPMTYKTYYDRFKQFKTYYLGLLRMTKGRYQDYKDFLNTKWSTHIGRGVFTNMCLDVGFSTTQTTILRGDKSTKSMEKYQDIISASYNISKALGLLEPQNAENIIGIDVSDYYKRWKEVEEFGKQIGRS